jgi:hypothetical protein
MRLVTRDCGFYGGRRNLLEDGVGKGDAFAGAGIAFGVQRKFLDNTAQKMMLGSCDWDGKCDSGNECEQAKAAHS